MAKYTIIKGGTSDGIRTHTLLFLRQLPLPLGYTGIISCSLNERCLSKHGNLSIISQDCLLNDYVNHHLYDEVQAVLDIHSILFFHNIHTYVFYILLLRGEALV